MPKFILLALFLGLLVSIILMPVPMEKLERKLEKDQLRLKQEIPSINKAAIASQNASKAFFNGTNHQKSIFHE